MVVYAALLSPTILINLPQMVSWDFLHAILRVRLQTVIVKLNRQ